ncbi:cytochrome-c oxidase, cbb3-type subunit I [Humisphaera borealis]|uniref:cytochrome-c oxidase n=1 Tax=Humisphaera borealis TaxID=2807512 RepID=A0A7M2WT06_9BACT|nr:cytochrome-c oxidase, cbb3-type subunit I [Humisphaera borealis]QOV88404.1 cytochrome-c oxidase, cbb3-type subunit I [Humisphaera borealis]
MTEVLDSSAAFPAEHQPEDAHRLAGALQTYRYDDKTVRAFLVATYVWGIVAFLVGLYVAVQLVWPQTSFGLEFLSFGRLRPLHTNAAIFAFAGNALFAAIYYSTQRLCKARMWSDKLSRAHFWGWQLIIVSAALTLPLGVTQGKEYAELEWPIDLMIAVVWLGFFGVNFFMTLKNRRERHLYVALWFYIATIVTVTVLHVFNNLVVPAGLFKSYSIYAGVQDAFMQWWYGHNAVAFFLTTPFLGLMYYFLPKAAERPVFSYRLSIVHFWSLVFLYIWAGPHHLHYTATPDWASTLGMLFSLMLWMPSWGGMINGLLTLRGAWNKVTTDPVLKFFVVGITFYGMSTFEGPLLSIKSVNALSHYTDWTIAHVHAGALGWNGFMTFGMIYWMLPRLFQTKIWSPKLVNAHVWLGTIGILLYVIPIYVAGITQGLMFRAITEAGQLQYPDFVETVQAIRPMYMLRILGGTTFLAGALIGGLNFFMTWRSRPRVYEEPTHSAPALAKHVAIVDARPEVLGTGIVAAASRLANWTTLWWHRGWERLPLKFTVLVIVAVAVASLFEIIPTFLVRSNVPTIASVKPYTPLELAGRDIYLAEGCYNCHSQMIRPMLAETKRYGEYSKPGEFVYDHPFQWGSRRIGPDLAREGGRKSDLWHYQHFLAPGEVTQGSIMPPYAWLSDQDTDFGSIALRVRAMQALGVPYTDADRAGASESAKVQAGRIAANIAQQGGPPGLEQKKVVALIAYVQRLGKDLFEPPPPGPAVPPPPPAAKVPPVADPATMPATQPAATLPATAPVAPPTTTVTSTTKPANAEGGNR